MAISIGINGFGRIGRVALRIASVDRKLLNYVELTQEMRILIIWSI